MNIFKLKSSCFNLVVAIVLIAFSATGAVDAQSDASSSLIIYAGNPMSATTMTVKAWGGGTAVDSTDGAYTKGGHGIRIETGGVYQGGQINFTQPVSLGNLKADKTRYLQFILSVAASNKYSASGPIAASAASTSYHYHLPSGSVQVAQAPRPYPGQPMPYPGMPGQQPGVPGGYPGQPGGMPGNPNAPAAAPSDVTSSIPTLPIQNLHVVLKFASGAQVDMIRPVRPGNGDSQWVAVSIPLAAIPVSDADAANAVLSAIFIGSDTAALLMIGEIRTVSNATPISAYAGEAQQVPTNTDVTFVATADGGVSALKFEWDFDHPDHFIDEAEGLSVVHHFSKAGTYKVTLRVSDVDGIKAAATATQTVTVSDQ